MEYLLTFLGILFLFMRILRNFKITYFDFLNFLYFKKSEIVSGEIVEFLGEKNSKIYGEPIPFSIYYVYKTKIIVDNKDYFLEILTRNEKLYNIGQIVNITYIKKKNGDIFFTNKESYYRFLQLIIGLVIIILIILAIWLLIYF